MKAIEISSFGAPEVLRVAERPMPEAREGEIVIRVQAAGVARADTLQRKGSYPPPAGASDIPGLDVAGTVYAAGPGVTEYRPGDGVCAILAGGGYAEFCAVPAPQVLPIPQGWTAVEAATLPENLFTVFDNVITRAGLQRGQTLLVHGGTSGIGNMATMLARAWGAEVIATAGTDEKCAACISLGARYAINYKQQDFVAEVARETGGGGVDVILDMIGGSYLERNIESLAVEGRLAIVSTQGGREGKLDLAKLMHKRARVMGSTMRARTAAQKGEVAQRLREQVWPLLPAKDPIRPVIDSTFPLADAASAHSRLESSQHIGKIVLIP
ncbi:MAG: NAD(P)H-quinone oxidoreductase [Acidobacteriaceae bacterium]|nr:NAD(P)H-quinone oxidoreductase [Acidobacteriaceae bacterium]